MDQMSDRQKKQRAKKAAATRQAKQDAALKDMGIEPRKLKPKKKRKPMTEAQKKLASERLEKARAARAVSSNNRPPIFSQYQPEDAFSWETTKENLVYLQEVLQNSKHLKDSSDWKERSFYLKIETQIHFLKQYLSTGMYGSLFYGKDCDKMVKYQITTLSYDEDGIPKID